MRKTYHGSCHCGAVKFEADIDLGAGIHKCNCTYCWKSRMLKVFALEGHFRLIEGEDKLHDYNAHPSNWPDGHIHHYSCKICSFQPFSKGYLEMDPFNGWFHAVNAACLDDASPEDIAAAPVIYEDGRNDHQERPPAFTAHL